MPRKPIQFFVGSGKWDDEAVMAELRHHVVETLGDPQGVLVFDPSAFPKKGTHSCGVERAWCGRLGKVENCQVGLFLAYATGRGQGPLDRQLYLPKDWAADRVRREEGHVPAGVKFQKRWRMALAMLDRQGASIRTGRWRPMMNLVGWRRFGPGCGSGRKPTCWMCRADSLNDKNAWRPSTSVGGSPGVNDPG